MKSFRLHLVLVKLCELNPLDMRTILHTQTDKDPVQSKQLGEREKNGRRRNFLEADLARVEIYNCRF